MSAQPTCQERVRAQWASTLDDLEKLWALYLRDPDEEDDDLGSLYDYGLAFDYVAPYTFRDQAEGYWRWQLSTGGPADEIRFFASHGGAGCYRIMYWFIDWYDGASVDVTGVKLVHDLWGWFQDMGAVDSAFAQATE